MQKISVSHSSRATKGEAFNFMLNMKTGKYKPSKYELDLVAVKV